MGKRSNGKLEKRSLHNAFRFSYCYKPDFNRCVTHESKLPNSFNKKASSLGDLKFTREFLVAMLTWLALVSTM